MSSVKTIIVWSVCVLAVAGCATSGTSGDQVTNSIFDTHRKVRDIEKNMAGLQQLNETAADLAAKVDASDAQMDQIQVLLEENREAVNRLDSRLTEVQRTLYKAVGVTPPPPSQGGSGSVPMGPANVTAPTEQTLPPPPPAMPAELPPPAEEPVVVPPVENNLDEYSQAQKSFLNQDYAAALQQFNAYLARNPNGEYAEAAQFWRGETHLKLGQYQEAASELRTFRQAYPNNVSKVPIAMYHEAEAQKNLGNRTQAIQLLEELIQNYPMSDPAKIAQDSLRQLRGN
ncbi:MAG: tetratricopeptide repeat protein [Candidatus Hydrogenedentes bacterium]|nr:tetratricopeptide repeat protein [Candidatus Hydrogenedentota bacterium]